MSCFVGDSSLRGEFRGGRDYHWIEQVRLQIEVLIHKNFYVKHFYVTNIYYTCLFLETITFLCLCNIDELNLSPHVPTLLHHLPSSTTELFSHNRKTNFCQI